MSFFLGLFAVCFGYFIHWLLISRTQFIKTKYLMLKIIHENSNSISIDDLIETLTLGSLGLIALSRHAIMIVLEELSGDQFVICTKTSVQITSEGIESLNKYTNWIKADLQGL